MFARLSFILSIVALSAPTFTHASQVLWGSARLATNYLSTGAPKTLNSAFTFQLGAFKPGFVPTASNTSEWLQNWTPAQSAQYNEHTRFFTGSYVYQKNTAPFLPGSKGYIFGFNRWATTEGGDRAEWILATDPSWDWPSGPANALPVQWSMSNASNVVLGSVGERSSGYHMMTASVLTPVTSLQGDLWAKRYLGGTGEIVSNLDSDHDGLTDQMEFFLSTNPLQPDQGRHTTTKLVEEGGEVYLELALFKLGQIAGSTLSVETSTDLVQWETAGDAFKILENSLLVFRARSNEPVSIHDKRYFRLKASVAP